MRVFLGVTGASGAPYAERLLRALAAATARSGSARPVRRRGAGDGALPRPVARPRGGARALRRGGRSTGHRVRRERLRQPVCERLRPRGRLRDLPVLDGHGGDARVRSDAEPHPPRRFGGVEGASQARARAAGDAALLDPPPRARDAERGRRGRPLRGAGLLPRRRVDRRPRRLRRGALPRPDRDRQRARRPLGRQR